MLDTPYFTPENVEQNLSLKELKMYLDDPHSKMQNQLMKYVSYAYLKAWHIGGTIDSIKKSHQRDANWCIQSFFYDPNQRLLVISGKIR